MSKPGEEPTPIKEKNQGTGGEIPLEDKTQIPEQGGAGSVRESKSSLQRILEKTPPPPLPSRRASPSRLEVAPIEAAAKREPPSSQESEAPAEKAPEAPAAKAEGPPPVKRVESPPFLKNLPPPLAPKSAASPGPPPGPPPVPSSPQVIPDGLILDSRYRLLQMLGEGGMGAVYKAEHILMRKPVAIKILKREAASEPDLVMRFTREAQLSSRLSNPHCVTVHDFGQTPDRSLYLVMELIEGESLRERLNREGRFSLSDAFGLFSQLLDALVAAHKLGVVHRDLKPENIMLVSSSGKDGEGTGSFLKLLDFGIARPSGQGAAGLTRAGFTVGTPGYIAPEQALGQAVDHRADLYSAGVIFYEMLLARRPYQGRSAMEVLTTQVSTPPPPPSQVAPEANVPAEVEEILLKVLAREAEERFSDATSLKTALEEVVLGLPSAAAPIEAPAPPPVVVASEPEGAEPLLEPPSEPLEAARFQAPLPSEAVGALYHEDSSVAADRGRRVVSSSLAFLFGALLSALLGYSLWAGEEAPLVAPTAKEGASPAWELLAQGKTSEARALLLGLSGERRYTSESQGLLALAAAREGDWEAARAAARAARALGGFPEEIRDDLLGRVAEASSAKAALARRVAGELGREALEDLFTMLTNSSEAQRQTAAAILAELDDPEVPREPLLLRALKESPSCDEKLRIVKTLQEQPGARVTGILQRMSEGLPGEDECLAAPLEKALKERGGAD